MALETLVEVVFTRSEPPEGDRPALFHAIYVGPEAESVAADQVGDLTLSAALYEAMGRPDMVHAYKAG